MVANHATPVRIRPVSPLTSSEHPRPPKLNRSSSGLLSRRERVRSSPEAPGTAGREARAGPHKPGRRVRLPGPRPTHHHANVAQLRQRPVSQKHVSVSSNLTVGTIRERRPRDGPWSPKPVPCRFDSCRSRHECPVAQWQSHRLITDRRWFDSIRGNHTRPCSALEA